MKITTRNGKVFIAPKLIWTGVPDSFRVCTDNDGKWFGPTEIFEIVDHPDAGQLQEIVKRVDGERDAAKAELEMVQRNIAVLRVENDALKSELANLQKVYNEGVEDRAKLNGWLETMKAELAKSNSELGHYKAQFEFSGQLLQKLQDENRALKSAQPFTQRFEITIKPV